MTNAAVGVHCPDCVAEGRRSTRSGIGPYGGTVSANPATTSWVLIAINLAVWALLLLTGGGAGPVYDVLALSPEGRCVPAANPTQYYPGVNQVECLAAGGTAWVPGVVTGASWQLLTSMFAHVDLMHVASNLLTLWFLGPQVERTLGRLRFLGLYLFSGLAGGVAVLWWSDPASSTLGASGAIFGLLGGLLVLALKVRANPQPILVWLGLNVVITIVGRSFISWEGHLGGLIGGLVLTGVLLCSPKAGRSRWQLSGFVGFAALLAVVTVAKVLLA
ncbi:MAG: rhomboid family intramembrane serine protease [Micropruina sp.]|nr:rhomboid family intramembrane serine protease [Micropruina sp.]